MTKIICGIASLPSRKDSLITVVGSLINQVDELYVALNNYPEVPPELRDNPKIHAEITDNSLKDSAKFLHAHECSGWYISWDDDIIAPPDAVSRLISGVRKYNALVGFHGRYYTPPITSFKRWTGNYRCLNTVNQDVRVNFIGSGCTCYHTDRLRVHISEFRSPGKADVWLSRIATLQGVPMYVLAHRAGEIQYLPVARGTTLWETTKDYSEHVSVLKTFIK